MHANLSRLSILFIDYRVTMTTQKYFYTSFRSVPGCQTCMYKRGIRCGRLPLLKILVQKNFGFFEIYGASARTTGKWVEGG